MKIIKNIVGILLLMNLMSSCSQKYSHGVFLSPKELKQLDQCKKEHCSIQKIYSTIGFPVLIEEERGYYIGLNYEKTFLQPKIIKSEIIEIIVSDTGNVQDVLFYKDIHNNNVKMHKDINYQYHDQTSGVSKFFNNAFKFNKVRKPARYK